MRRTSDGKARDVFGHHYAQRYEKLSPSYQRVAAFIDANRLTVLTSSAMDIARAVGTSDATVVRAVQALGFSGLQDLRQQLAASYSQSSAPVDNLKRTLAEISDNVEAALDAILEVYAAGLEAVRSTSFRQSALAALNVLHGAQRIAVFGIGPTAHIAAYFAARLRRKGIRQTVIDKTGSALADQLLELMPGDCVLMLAYGTPYREASATVAEARRLNLPVVLITDATDTDLARCSQVVLSVPRGRSNRMALHGVTVFCMEMLLLGLATSDSRTAVRTLAELERLRHTVRPGRRMTVDETKLEE